MILIISQRTDYATTCIIRWLLFYKKEFLRINKEDDYRVIKIGHKDVLIEKQNNVYNLSSCNSYLYRRNALDMVHLGGYSTETKASDTSPICLRRSLKNEMNILKNTIYEKIESSIGSSKAIGSYFTHSMNKIRVLDLAHNIGLLTPYTAIVSTKKELENIISQRGTVITKACYETIYGKEQDSFYSSYTTRITPSELNSIPDKFMLSMIQEEIVKQYELRIFYLKGHFFPSVTFSQKREETSVDCRNASEFRYLPYKLPKNIECLLEKLMIKLGLQTGSIDMMVNTKGQYVFLEVNPVGQFQVYGNDCNYYIEKEIAKLL